MNEQEYENRKSWLIDTAETPKDRKNLPKELADLKKLYKASTKAGGIDNSNAKAHVAELYRNTSSIKKKPNTKLGGREMDPTKIPGFKFGGGTE